MEIGDIIYIILIGIFVLGGLLRRRKRSAQRQELQEEEVETAPAFSGQGVQDFDDWLMGKEIAQPKPIPVTPEKKTVKNQNADIFFDLRPKQKTAKPTKPQNFPDLSSNLRVKKNNNINLNIELNTAEDARRAFIYSEIFQRRY